MSQYTIQDILRLCNDNNISYSTYLKDKLDFERTDLDTLYQEMQELFKFRSKLSMVGVAIKLIMTYDENYLTPLIQIVNISNCKTDQLVRLYEKYSDDKYICMCEQSKKILDYVKNKSDSIGYNSTNSQNISIIHFGLIRYSCYRLYDCTEAIKNSGVIVKEQCKMILHNTLNNGEVSAGLKQFLSFSPKHIKSLWNGVLGITNNTYVHDYFADIHLKTIYKCIIETIKIQFRYEITHYYIDRIGQAQNSKQLFSLCYNLIEDDDSINKLPDIKEIRDALYKLDEEYDSINIKSFKKFCECIIEEFLNMPKMIDSIDNRSQSINFSTELSSISREASKFTAVLRALEYKSLNWIWISESEAKKIIKKYNIEKKKK